MIGLDWDGDVVRQSDRFDRYTEAIDRLAELGLVYECYCTRSEIRAEIAAAPQAPHGPPGSYPGTCRDLSEAERRRHRSDGRPPALRLRSDGRAVTFRDRVHGETTGVVDDVVLRRNDGVPAYNLAVVVDDAAQGITEVVRGDDLLSSTPRQIALQQLLGLPQPEFVHVPLVVDDEGRRLAKRRGEPVTLGDLAAAGIPTDDVVAWIGASLGRSDVRGSSDVPGLVDGFDVAALGTGPVPWTLGRTRTIR